MKEKTDKLYREAKKLQLKLIKQQAILNYYAAKRKITEIIEKIEDERKTIGLINIKVKKALDSEYKIQNLLRK